MLMLELMNFKGNSEFKESWEIYHGLFVWQSRPPMSPWRGISHDTQIHRLTVTDPWTSRYKDTQTSRSKRTSLLTTGRSLTSVAVPRRMHHDEHRGSCGPWLTNLTRSPHQPRIQIVMLRKTWTPPTAKGLSWWFGEEAELQSFPLRTSG